MTQELDSIRTGEIGISPRAILLIPRLVVERPLRRNGAPGRFAGSVAETLKGALKRARRPWETHSGDDPLLFEDEADAAAALIGSWLGGSGDRSWWPAVTGGLDPPSWVRRHVLCDGFILPRIVTRLLDRGIVHSWIARLDPIDVEQAIATLARTYGLRASPAPRQSPVADRDGGAPVALALAIVPEIAEPSLPPRGRMLLTIALMADRRPAFLATPAAERMLAAVAEFGTPGPSLPRIQRSRPMGHQSRRRPAAQAATPPPKPERAARHVARIAPDPRPIFDRPAPQEPQTAVAKNAPVEPAVAAQVATNFGGLLFLLNALISLEIYGDFTRPCRSVPGLSPFALLASLGTFWFGRSFRADPLHPLLLELAGGSEANAGFTPPRWSVPRSWLEPWPLERSLWACRGGRSRTLLWHPARFPILHLQTSEARNIRQAMRHAGFRRLIAKDRLPRLPRQPRDCWIACLALYLRARLNRTLERTDAVQFLCRQQAVVQLDDDRLTAAFALADHPLAVRLVGLDRDPGWIPAAGRIVEFAFE